MCIRDSQGQWCVGAERAGHGRSRSTGVVWVSHLDSSDEAARGETVLGVELTLDRAHELQSADRAPHVEVGLEVARSLKNDDSAAEGRPTFTQACDPPGQRLGVSHTGKSDSDRAHA